MNRHVFPPNSSFFPHIIPVQPSKTVLMLGEGLFGPRYYLAGKPVYDGSPLIVRTLEGWLEGMFVWSGWPQDRPKLVFMGQTHVPITLELTTDLRWEL